jgi:hypothetical protein
MSRHLKGVIAFAAAAALAGCSGGGGAGHACTGIGSRTGVGLEITPPLAVHTARAVLKICWDGTCHPRRLRLDLSTKSVPQGCTGREPDDACGAIAVRTGGKNGFADLPGLPKRPIKVTATLSDATGRRLLDLRIDVTPRAVFPNGLECGESGPQVTLIADNNRLRART